MANSKILQAQTDFIIFFDNQHVQRYCISFNVSTSISGQPAQAGILMIYDDALTKIDYLTDVRIFSKNVFSGKYLLIFSGQIYQRNISWSSGEKTITFSCLDNLAWLQKLPLPIMFGIGSTLDTLTVFQWVSKGINYDTIKMLPTMGDTEFAGKNLEQLIIALFSVLRSSFGNPEGLKQGALENTIYDWMDIEKKLRVISDMYATNRDNNTINIITSGTTMENMYLFLMKIIQQTGYELFQDRDELIKIKEPFYNEAIFSDHIIDPIIVTNFNDTYDWSTKYTRVLVVGGLESSISQLAGVDVASYFVPAGTYLGGTDTFITTDKIMPIDGTVEKATGIQTAKTVYPPSPDNLIASLEADSFYSHAMTYQGVRHGETTSKDHISINSEPTRLPGKPYLWSGSMDCSYFITQALIDSGYNIGRKNALGYKQFSIPVTSATIKKGDLGFTESGLTGISHVGIYGGYRANSSGLLRHYWLESGVYPPVTGKDIEYRSSVWEREYEFLDRSGGNAPSLFTAYGDVLAAIRTGNYVPTTIPTISAENKKIAALSPDEKKYGVNLLEVVQPYIRVPVVDQDNSTVVGTAYSQLSEYTRYLYSNANANSNNAALSMISAPWLRLGVNLLFDPNGMNRVYYVSAINHAGSPGGVTTSVTLTNGRSQEEYISSYKKETSFNPFTESTKHYPSTVFTNDLKKSYYEGTDTDMTAAKSLLKGCNDKLSSDSGVDARSSEFHKVYGIELQRRTGLTLNYWDQEYTIYELYLILEQQYGGTSKSIISGMSATGELNPKTAAEIKYASVSTKGFVDSMPIPPAFIIERKNNLRSIITALDASFKSKYDVAERRYL